MKDRFVRGYTSGALAGILSHLINFGLVKLHFGALYFIDFAGIFLYGQRRDTLLSDSFSLVGYIFVCALLGAVYAYVLPLLGSDYHLLKGTVFGLTFWLLVYCATLLFKVPYVTQISVNSAINNFIAAASYGVFLDILHTWLLARVTRTRD